MLNRVFDTYLHSYIKVLEGLGLVEWRTNFDRSKIANRSLVILDEAKKRKIPVQVLHLKGEPKRFFKAKLPSGQLLFEIMPLVKSYRKSTQATVDHKMKMKLHLKKLDAPVVDSFVFRNANRAINFSKYLSFPVVIKPTYGSLSRGVTVNIKSDKELQEAIQEAKKFYPSFIMEKYVCGESYRVTLVNFQYIAAAKRIPANIVGTGRHTIRDLVAIKNLDDIRGEPEKLDTTLHQICLNEDAKNFLAKQGLAKDSIPAQGERIFLGNKVNLGSGADIIDVTEKMHQKTRSILEEVAMLFDARVLGVDIVVSDISKPLTKENGAIIELNSYPYIDMHHFPYQGRSRNVAAAIWQMILSN